jgi:hypothetical protein
MRKISMIVDVIDEKITISTYEYNIFYHLKAIKTLNFEFDRIFTLINVQ